MIIVAFIGGLVLGALFFGGLWLTVKKTLGSPYVAIWVLGSSLLRTAFVLTGFYFLGQGSLPHLLISVAGFVAGRFLILRLTRQTAQKQVMITESRQL